MESVQFYPLKIKFTKKSEQQKCSDLNVNHCSVLIVNQHYMQDRQWKDRELFEKLYQIICDIVCVPRKTVRISGEEYPYELVKSKFLKLKACHLEYVILCMENNTTKVGNIKSYLTTALYNAPNTMNHYYSSAVNHDLYGA